MAMSEVVSQENCLTNERTNHDTNTHIWTVKKFRTSKNYFKIL